MSLAAAAGDGFWSSVCSPSDLSAKGGLVLFRHGTVTPCFSDTTFSLSLYVHLACTAWSLGDNPNSSFVRLPRNWRLNLRRKIASLLMAIPVVYLLVVQLLQGHELTPLRYVSVAMTIVVWAYHLAYYLQHKRKDELHLTFSSALCTVSSALRSYSLLNDRADFSDSLSYNVELYCSLVSTICLLLYTCLTIRPWTSVPSPAVSMENVLSASVNNGFVQFAELEDETGRLGKAEEDANIFSLLSFWWVGRLMRRGFRGGLNQPHDLFDLPHRLQAEELAFRYSQIPSRLNLTSKLQRLLGGPFLIFGIVKLVNDICTFAGPFLLNKLVSCFQDNPDMPVHLDAYTYACMLAGTALLSAILNTHYNYQMEKVKLKMKTTLMAAIYQKSLKVGLAGRSFLSGKALNLMTTDCDRLANFCTSFHMFWSLPLQVIVTLYMLYHQVGMAFLAGLGFVIVLLPINRWLANRIGVLSEKMMEAKDKRITLVREVLRGFLYIRMHSWTNLFHEKIRRIREEEVRQLAGRKYLDAWCVFFWATTPVLVSVLTFITWGLTQGDPASLSPAKVFTTLALFNLLIMPLNAFPWVLNGIVEAKVSLDRMQRLMKMDDFEPGWYYAETVGDPDVVLRFSCVEFEHYSYEKNDTPSNFKLGPLTLTLKKGEFLGVIGEVGAGKSSLFAAILGDMRRIAGSLEFSQWNRSVAFVSQNVWLQKTTIRNNVTFGHIFYAAIYRTVLTACALDEDIEDFPDGDLTDVGEEGSRLSGGQRMRVSLARAVYCALVKPEATVLVLLDDPFLSLDVHVANRIYRECVCKLLGGTTRILATHHTRFLDECTAVLSLRMGQCIGYGPPLEILPRSPADLLAGRSKQKTAVDAGSPLTRERGETSSAANLSVEEEPRGRGSIASDVLWFYVGSIGVTLTVVTLLAIAAMQVSRTATDAWLAFYVSQSHPDSTTRVVTGAVTDFFLVYSLLAVANSILTLCRAFLFAYAGLRGARGLHDRLLSRVLHAPITFFEKTPLGQVLNRFSSDVYTIDDSLPFIANIFFAQSFALAGTIALTCYGLPWILLLLLPLSMGYASVQRYYRWTSRELKRLSSVTLSPLYSHLSESFAGAVVIRAFCSVPIFTHQLHTRINTNNQCQLMSIAASQWLGLRLQLIGVALTSGVAFLSVVEHHRVDTASGHIRGVNAAIVGLVLSYVLSISSLLSGVVSSFAETEREMVSVERVSEYIESSSLAPDPFSPSDCPDRPSDPPGTSPSTCVPFGWPHLGWINFHQVVLSYSSTGPASLNGVSFDLPGGQRLGIVGRTGAGKSSLVQALFCLRPLRSGSICIDGVDLSTVPVPIVRRRIACIPQEAFVFVGSIRDNLDPTGMHTDYDLWNALSICSLNTMVQNNGGLDGFRIEERGGNLSTGQRQLVCLARAILTKTRVLCMDEATSGVDADTEKAIQRTLLSNALRGTTVIFVAHRVQSVLETCDLVAVMSAGKFVQFGAPRELAIAEGAFKDLLDGNQSTGRVS